MATVINGEVDAPAGAQRRTFPLVMAMFSPDYANAKSWAWNVTMDRQLPWQSSVEVSYVGRAASNLERARNINQLQPGTVQANPLINTNALRPYKGFSTITLYETTGRSRYDAMQLQVQRRSARGVAYSFAYTYSRTMDDGSSRLEILPNAYDDSGYYGISGLDRPHVLITQASYRTPALESAAPVLRGVLGDWNIGGVLQAQSGAPFDVTTTVDIAGVGAGSGPQVLQHRWRSEGGPHRLRRHPRGVVQPGSVPGAYPGYFTRPIGSATTCGSPGSGICTCRCGRACRSARIEPNCAGTCSTC